MNTLTNILSFLVFTFGTLYFYAILLRFLLQSARADFYNPVSQALVKITNPLLIPLRRIIPGLWGIDFACLVLAVLFHWAMMQILLFISGYSWVAPHLMLVWALISLALNIITIYLFSGFVIFISSFIAPYSRHPILVLVRQLMEPLMAPIRRFVPPVGGLDFSLFFVGIGLIVLRMVVQGLGSQLRTPFGALLGYV